MNTQPYKNYIGYYEWEEDDKVFYGRLQGICDIVTFEGNTIEAIEKDFQETVDDYLEWLLMKGDEPETPPAISQAVNQ
jgi:predicted HicB family RNase H-like nuclease